MRRKLNGIQGARLSVDCSCHPVTAWPPKRLHIYVCASAGVDGTGPLTAPQMRQIKKRVPQSRKRSVHSSLFEVKPA